MVYRLWLVASWAWAVLLILLYLLVSGKDSWILLVIAALPFLFGPVLVRGLRYVLFGVFR